ncbi:type VII secretion system-associated protein [Streptomyces xiangluensis]|uniref:Type VII secretion system-associated protein n=1 Tax=Streptomyces xiangluensis TaxID=2665720 RepID=A0ABV8YTS4_9ACTN
MAEDPQAKTGKLSMDKAGLQAFLDDRVELFKDELRKIALDDDSLGVQAVGSLIGETKYTSSKQFDSYGLSKPLRLGMMLKGERLNGKGEELNTAIAKTAEDLTTLYEEQTALFADIADNLKTTMEKLLAAQNDNLTKVDGQDFLDIFEDVVSGLSGGQGGGGEEKDED